jgi:hypothetical protein
MQSMYYIGLDVHKRTISYCVKDVSAHSQKTSFIVSAPSSLLKIQVSCAADSTFHVHRFDAEAI